MTDPQGGAHPRALGGAALEMIALQRALSIDDGAKRAVAEMIMHLPPHGDVVDALRRLRDAGCRLATLTNSAPPVVETQLRAAGIRDHFDAVISVDEVRRYKPAPEAYHLAASRLDSEAASVWLVAAHGWDVWGASQAGMRTAFVARPGQGLVPFAPRPDVTGRDLSEVVERILAYSA